LLRICEFANTTGQRSRLADRADGVAAEIARLLRTNAAANVAAKKVDKLRMMAPGGEGWEIWFSHRCYRV